MIRNLRKVTSQHASPNPSPSPSPCASPQVPARSYNRQPEPEKKPVPETPYKAPVILVQPEPQKLSQPEPEKSVQPEPQEPQELSNLAKKLSNLNIKPYLQDIPTPKDEDEVSNKAIDIDDEAAKLRAQRTMVWAEQLMNHKELTTADKIGLPKFFKSREEIRNLEDELFDLAANSEDVSLITVTSELIGQIETLFSGYDL